MNVLTSGSSWTSAAKYLTPALSWYLLPEAFTTLTTLFFFLSSSKYAACNGPMYSPGTISSRVTSRMALRHGIVHPHTGREGNLPHIGWRIDAFGTLGGGFIAFAEEFTT